MSDGFLIGAPVEIDWCLSEDDFEHQLRTRWNNVEVHRLPPERTNAVNATIEDEGPTVIIGLQRNGSTVTVDGDLDQAITIAMWYRGLVPREHPLLFFDEAFTADVELTPDTTAEELAAPFAAG